MTEDNTHELSGDGVLIIDGENVDTVYYWLTVVPKAGPLIAEGSITGTEQLMRRVKKARQVKLALDNGPVLTIRCAGGRMGVRWVQALSDNDQ
jgi:hypothetical protein